MFHRIRDLIVVVAVACLAAISILFTVDNVIVRDVLGLPLALMLPGYAITAAIFPSSRLGFTIRFLFSLSLTLAVTALGSLVLDRTPWGLQSASWLVLLWSVTVGACIITALRRRGETIVLAMPTSVGISLRQGILFGFAALIVVVAIGIASSPTSSQGIEGYTLLWLLPAHDASQNEVHLGVQSKELIKVSYKLQLFEGEHQIREWPSIEVSPGETWESTEALQSGETKAPSIRALLFRLDGPEWPPYRSVELKLGPQER